MITIHGEFLQSTVHYLKVVSNFHEETLQPDVRKLQGYKNNR